MYDLCMFIECRLNIQNVSVTIIHFVFLTSRPVSISASVSASSEAIVSGAAAASSKP
jgi:hypothetical protein